MDIPMIAPVSMNIKVMSGNVKVTRNDVISG